ncbi:MAG: hypothetical protein BWK73_32785 [Thiothrix lacustris]|uniref:Heparan-alpha-glucosaminide N-acetyltransferase catalytic domain-containing protein n=1 Tax=Thiothrix lacustris TaxID=525917 RepID=A0A1Y1QHA8_9GAMM|nr:MAG: hypothetical protein BWK73_32785 [Thiothrix lacustris]
MLSKPSSPVGGKISRLELPDALRGLAVLLMVVFHSAYDLNHFNLLQLDLLHSNFWPAFQRVIVTLFVGVAGMSLALASRQGLHWQRFWRREGLLLVSAALVSVGSYALFPTSWIFFGVLHFMVVASLLAVPLLRLGGWNMLLGVLCIALPWWADPFFNAAWLQWLGLGTVVSSTKDYTPLLPWFGVMLLGIYAGNNLEVCRWCLQPLPRWGWTQGLVGLGKHSLAVYLLHQPLLMALFWLVASVKFGVTGK